MSLYNPFRDLCTCLRVDFLDGIRCLCVCLQLAVIMSLRVTQASQEDDGHLLVAKMDNARNLSNILKAVQFREVEPKF